MAAAKAQRKRARFCAAPAPRGCRRVQFALHIPSGRWKKAAINAGRFIASCNLGANAHSFCRSCGGIARGGGRRAPPGGAGKRIYDLRINGCKTAHFYTVRPGGGARRGKTAGKIWFLGQQKIFAQT